MFCVPYFLTVPIGQTNLRTCYGTEEKIQWSMGGVVVYGREYWECVPNGDEYVFWLSNISNGVKHMFCVPYFLTVPIGQTKVLTCYGTDEKIQWSMGGVVCIGGSIGSVYPMGTNMCFVYLIFPME